MNPLENVSQRTKNEFEMHPLCKNPFRFLHSLNTIPKYYSTLKRKAILTLTPAAIDRLKVLMQQGQYLKVSTRLRGCSGNAYHLEYVSAINKFDEVVQQDQVQVVVDSRALFSLIGSEMDYKSGDLSSGFVFNNPNVKETCGCGASFMV